MGTSQLQVVLRHVREFAEKEVLVAATDGSLLNRFVCRRDEEAFAALLRRHGPMVLAVARRVLQDEHDAEDVFQAAFLLLARRASSIRRGDAVSAWLYGVALRLALKVKSQRFSRQKRERKTGVVRRGTDDEAAFRELQEALERTLQTLPEKYRTVLLLCYLQG